LGEARRGDLKTDLWDVGGVVLAQKIDEVVLVKTEFEGMLLGQAPFLVAATDFPVGNVALGDDDVVFVESADNPRIGNVVSEQAVHHFPQVFGETSDLAVAGAFAVTPLKQGVSRRR